MKLPAVGDRVYRSGRPELVGTVDSVYTQPEGVTYVKWYAHEEGFAERTEDLRIVREKGSE